MALIICPECGKDVSDKAKVCIHCGYPLADEMIKSNVIEQTYEENKPEIANISDKAETDINIDDSNIGTFSNIDVSNFSKQTNQKKERTLSPIIDVPVSLAEGLILIVLLIAAIAVNDTVSIVIAVISFVSLLPIKICKKIWKKFNHPFLKHIIIIAMMFVLLFTVGGSAGAEEYVNSIPENPSSSELLATEQTKKEETISNENDNANTKIEGDLSEENENISDKSDSESETEIESAIDYTNLTEEEYKAACIPVYYETIVKEENYAGQYVKFNAYVSGLKFFNSIEAQVYKTNSTYTELHDKYNIDTFFTEVCIQTQKLEKNYGPQAYLFYPKELDFQATDLEQGSYYTIYGYVESNNSDAYIIPKYYEKTNYGEILKIEE